MITPANLAKHSITPSSRNKTPNSAYGIARYGTAVYRSSQSVTFTNLAKNNVEFLITEAGDKLVTENGDFLITGFVGFRNKVKH